MSSTTFESRPSTREYGRAYTGPILVAVGENGEHVIRAALALGPVLGERVEVFSAIEPLPVEFLSSEPILVPPSFEEGRRASRQERVRARVAELGERSRGWKVEV